VNHPWAGDASCGAAVGYRERLRDRREQEVERLSSLTGWNISEIRRKAGLAHDPTQPETAAWWERLWKK
jgi:hypothetical protein